jgi:hypothetical protein
MKNQEAITKNKKNVSQSPTSKNNLDTKKNTFVDKNTINNIYNDVDINRLLLERNIKTIPKNWSEVSFRIKLTENEYKELMKEKSRNVKI